MGRRAFWHHPGMGFLEFILSTLTSTILIAWVVYLLRGLIITRLKKSVQNEFDSKLAVLTSQLRTSEEAFKADIKRKEGEILALQGGAIQSRLSRQATVDKRRLEAIDQLWGAVYELSWAKALSAQVSILKGEAISKEVARNPKAKELFAMWKIDETRYEKAGQSGQKARPFITQVAWAYFAAYQAILMHAVAFMKMLQMGIDGHQFMNSENLIKLIKTALPHHSAYIDQHGPNAAYYLLDQLENSLLEEFKRMLDGVETDMTEIARAKQILIEASRVNSENSEGGKDLT